MPDFWDEAGKGYSQKQTAMSDDMPDEIRAWKAWNDPAREVAYEMLEALKVFCERVERGEVLSKRSYEKFKALIAKAEGRGLLNKEKKPICARCGGKGYIVHDDYQEMNDGAVHFWHSDCLDCSPPKEKKDE